MRIAWATPTNVQSAIAAYSVYVCETLADEGFDVALLSTEALGAERLAKRATRLPRHDDWTAAQAAEAFDVTVVNLGDHAPFHYRAMELYARTPCVTVFHDSRYDNLNWRLAREGLDLEPLIEPSSAGDAALNALFPRLSLGGIVHSPHYKDDMQAVCSGPVVEIPLCFPSVEPAAARRLEDRYVVSTFGMINPNKQADRVIRALAARPFDKPVEYRLIGSIAPTERERLLSLADRAPWLTLTFLDGWVDDQVLAANLAQSHVVCCLRFPVTEGGSASLISALYSERPLVVSDIASYRRVPRDLVRHVSYGEDADDLRAAIADLFADTEAAERNARRAGDWAREVYSAEAYVRRLSPFLRRIEADVLPLWSEAGRVLRLASDSSDSARAAVSGAWRALIG